MTTDTNTNQIIINEVDDGQRLDRWIKKNYPAATFGEIQKILRTGQVRLDGKRVKGETRLVEGQILRLPPQLLTPAPKRDRWLSDKDIDFIRSLVIYEDKDVIALNKPAGIASQGGTKVGRNIDHLIEGLSNDGVKPHLVHRLDKDTTGVMLLAKNPKVARALGDIFKGREVRKYYWAVTTPAPELHQGKIKNSLAKVSTSSGERMMAVSEDEGRMALTYYNVMEAVGKNLALVAFWPHTGRQHQIRVHAAEMGCPLLGDFKYDPVQQLLQDNPELPHTVHLHARRLILPHPTTGKTLDITAPLGPDMRKTFKFFGFSAEDKSDPFEDLD
jgi:23S rRNA pseudouridine955/2504/2580 synthase